MPSYDITSEVNLQEVDNAVNQSRKEILTRFDLRGSKAAIEFLPKENTIHLTAEDAAKVQSLHEILIPKLAKRGIDLRNVIRKSIETSSTGHSKQEITLLQGIEGEKAKEMIQFVKASKIKVQCSLLERQIRVTGKSRDDLQASIQLVKSKDFSIYVAFGNFRS